jgi:transposase
MRDTQLYQQILGVSEPWSVSRVELVMDESGGQGQVDVFVEHASDAVWGCPVCGKAAAVYDHAAERSWRHLDSCQLRTFLHARVPRVKCEEHGVHLAKVPWAEARSRFTMLMERMIIDVICQCSTITGACSIMRVSWDEAFGVMQRAVERGRARKQTVGGGVTPHIGVDEKAFRKGHSYLTVVCDLDRSSVEYVAENRTSESLAGYYASLTPEQREGIEAVAMDMWEPYVQATKQGLPRPGGKIVYDRFHIMKNMNEALDKVRLAEHREISSWGCQMLKGSKHWWLYGKENLPERYGEDFGKVRDAKLKTSRAWAIKETLRELWSYTSKQAAGAFFGQWFGWAKRSKLRPVKQVADMIKTRLEGVLNYCEHPITNGVAEGLNSRIMTIKRKCCGFRNIENFKTAIYFHCGKLDLYPH